MLSYENPAGENPTGDFQGITYETPGKFKAAGGKGSIRRL
jgi:hypothetical protein